MTRMKVVVVLLLAAALAAGAWWWNSGGDEGERRLRVAGKSYTEALLTSEILAQLLENSGFTVERIFDMSSAVCFQAVRGGDADLYPEYTGSMLSAYLGIEIPPGTSAEETFRMAKEGAEREFNLIVFPSMGFNNTYANAIRREFAEEHGIVTNSDLAPFSSQLVYGAEHAFFDRLDGFYNMSEMYGYEFMRYVRIDVGLKQISMNQREIDVTNIYTTDGWLEGSGLTVLEDDLNFFPAYDLCPVVRRDVLERYPELNALLSSLANTATEGDMVRYNNLVDSGRMNVAEAAAQFLNERNLLR